MDGVFSPEKNDAKISHFGQAVLIQEHVIPGHVGFKKCPSSAKTSLENLTKNARHNYCTRQWAFFTPAAYAPYCVKNAHWQN